MALRTRATEPVGRIVARAGATRAPRLSACREAA